MSDEIVAFKGEIMLLRWNESHNSGATVTFQLSDAEDLEPFKSMTVRKGKIAGQRLACVLVEIGDDEKPIVQEKPKGGPLAKSAGILCDTPEFQRFIVEKYCYAFDGIPQNYLAATNEQCQSAAVRFLRSHCEINSRSELDHDPEAAKRFHELMAAYRKWTVEG